MPDSITRREAIASTIGVLGAGSVAVFTSSESSSAASVSGEFRIPDQTKTVSSPVQSVQLNVSGSVGWEADTTPTKAILRLEVSRSGAFEQMAASKLPDLSRDYSHDFAFEGVRLISHERVSMGAVNPTSIGETKSLNLRARLTLTVKKDGHTLASDQLTENLPIEITRKGGAVDASLGAEGSVVVVEKTDND